VVAIVAESRESAHKTIPFQEELTVKAISLYALAAVGFHKTLAIRACLKIEEMTDFSADAANSKEKTASNTCRIKRVSEA